MKVHCHSSSQEWWSTIHRPAAPPLQCIKKTENCLYTHFRAYFFSDNNVLIVIGGDSCYKNEDEEARCVISRWAKRKMALQFGEEYLDGRQSFIFSWHKKHRMIHEEAMRHFLDPGKRGSKFEYTLPRRLPKPIELKVPQPLPKPIPPLEPRPASADTDLSREVGYTLPLTNNFRINPFNPKAASIRIDSTVSPPNTTPPSTRLREWKALFFIAVVGEKGVYSYFSIKGYRKKICTRQSQNVIWDTINTLFLTL